MVLIDLFLQFVPLFQQRPILRGEISHNLAERFPEPIGVHTGARRDLISDKLIQFFINLKLTYLNEVRHAFSSSISALDFNFGKCAFNELGAGLGLRFASNQWSVHPTVGVERVVGSLDYRRNCSRTSSHLTRRTHRSGNPPARS